MTTKKRVGYRVIKRFGKYHLYTLEEETTWRFFGLWPSKYSYATTHSAHYNEPDAIAMMKTLIDADAITVESDDYDLKGGRINICY